MRQFTLAELSSHVGQNLGLSDWIEITQAQVQQFADATGDQQWIHTDPVRAAAGPFGAPIAHGFLTLSLLPKMFETAFTVSDSRMGVNYGLNKVRFTQPTPVGAKVRAQFKLLECTPLPPLAGSTDLFSGMHMVVEAQIYREGSDKPVCVAESITRRYV